MILTEQLYAFAYQNDITAFIYSLLSNARRCQN